VQPAGRQSQHAIHSYAMQASPIGREILQTFAPGGDFVAAPGNDGPASNHRRLAGIIRRVPEAISPDIDFKLLADPEAQALIKAIAEFPDRIAQAAVEYEPSVISRYLLDLSTRIHSFLHERRVLDGQVEGRDPAEVRRARVLLVALAKKVLAEALELLGIEAVEQM